MELNQNLFLLKMAESHNWNSPKEGNQMEYDKHVANFLGFELLIIGRDLGITLS